MEFYLTLRLLAKVCIDIFVILSGYGYSESIKNKPIGLLTFYKKRLVTIYSNYWFIAIIFVPIGILFMGRPLSEAFASHFYMNFALQMIGLYGEHGYNGTWWYISLIIPLIILFPFMFTLTKKYGLIFLSLCLLIFLSAPKLHIPIVQGFLMSFALGIYLSQSNGIVLLSNLINRYKWWRYLILIMLILLVVVVRSYIPVLYGRTSIDWLFGGLIIFFMYEISEISKRVCRWLAFCGEHLFNIFLFHSFICYYYWADFIYLFHFPLLIFVVLLFVCLAVSILIEIIKKLLFFYKIVESIKNVKVPPKIDRIFQ